jgi:hypothetical protein
MLIILEFITYVLLTSLSVYGLVVFRRFDKHMTELWREDHDM